MRTSVRVGGNVAPFEDDMHFISRRLPRGTKRSCDGRDQSCATRALDAVRREGTWLRLRCSKTHVVSRMVVTRRHDRGASCDRCLDERYEWGDHVFALRHSKGAARHEVVLKVEEDECIVCTKPMGAA